MDFSIDTIKSDVVTLSTKDFLIKYLLKSDNWYFSEYLGLDSYMSIKRMECLKEILNDKLGVAYHNVWRIQLANAIEF